MTEIIPGIHQLPTPLANSALGFTNTYLIQGDKECLLIDPGANNEEAFSALKKHLAKINISFKDITQIIATHSHPDHYGLCGRVKQLSQAKILLHYRERDQLQLMHSPTGERWRQTEQWLCLNGAPANELPIAPIAFTERRRVPTLTLPDIILRGGETISTGVFSFQLFWTPGHSPGHICLYEPTQKILFSGDHVLPVITPNVSLQTQSDNNPLGDFFNSLNIVKQLDVKLVLPAHEHLFTDLATRVEEIFHHHKQRNSEILEAMKTKPQTAYQISAKITWMPESGGVSFQDLAPWDKRLAVLETLAHLQSLRIDGRVATFPRDTIVYYQPT